jgi:hypothetical protein
MSWSMLSTVASGALALLFGWAGLGKLVRSERWRQDLTRYRLPRSLRISTFLLLPWVELSVAIGLVAGARAAGAAVALGLMAAFSLAIVRARLLQQGNKLGCGCFGGSALLDYRVMLLRNAAMAALLGFVLVADAPEQSGQAPGRLLSTLLGLVLVAAVLWMGWQVRVHLQRRQRQLQS